MERERLSRLVEQINASQRRWGPYPRVAACEALELYESLRGIRGDYPDDPVVQASVEFARQRVLDALRRYNDVEGLDISDGDIANVENPEEKEAEDSEAPAPKAKRTKAAKPASPQVSLLDLETKDKR